MLSNWYKRQRARKEAPHLMRWIVLMPAIGIGAIFAARWALTNINGFLSEDQANFMVASLVVIAVPAFVFCGYSIVRFVALARDAQLTVWAMLTAEEESQ